MGLFLSIHYQHCDQALNCFLLKVGMGNNSGRPTHLSTARGESWAPSASRAPELCPHGRCAHPNSQINIHSPEIPSPPTPHHAALGPSAPPSLYSSGLWPKLFWTPPGRTGLLPKRQWRDLEAPRWEAWQCTRLGAGVGSLSLLSPAKGVSSGLLSHGTPGRGA